MSICHVSCSALLLPIFFVSVAFAQDGYSRNDAWNTADQAARRGLTDAATASRQEQGDTGRAVEYGGWVYQNNDGSYGYTTPKTSHDADTIRDLHADVIDNPVGDASDQSYVPRLPTGERVVGVYHNHPNYSTHDGEHFSLPDLNYAERYNVAMYLVTPQFDYLKYDPDEHDPDTFDFNHDNDEVEPHVDDDQSRVAHAEGEPHLGTHDGSLFDFQAAGEFVAIRSDDKAFKVLLRLEPYAGLNFVSIVTGASVAVGNHRVGIYASEPYLMVDGEAVYGVSELPGGFVANNTGDTIELVTAVGVKISARRRYKEWLDVRFVVDRTLFGRIQGLLGDYDDNPDNDFQTRDGEVIDLRSGSSRERREKLYRVWGESWRVREGESAFDYVHGKTEAEFRSFGPPQAVKTYADLDRNDTFTAASEQCRALGAYQKTALERCIFDVVVTDDARFAETYRDDVGIGYESAVAADEGLEFSDRIAAAEEVSRHRILVRNPGQKMFVVQERFDRALDLVKVGLYDKNGTPVASKCFGCGNLGLFSVESPGTYYFQAGGERESATGTYTLRYWYVPDPDRFVVRTDSLIAPGRPGPGAGRIERPGASDEYRFDVAANSVLRVEVMQFDATIDLVTWQIANGERHVVVSKCLGCGAEESVTLATAGEYVLRVGTVDRERGTGSYSMALSLAGQEN